MANLAQPDYVVLAEQNLDGSYSPVGTEANPLNIGAELTVGDIQIGAVEIKNDSDDTRMKIGAGVAANGARVTLATDDGLHVKIGEVQASPSANTILDRLKAILTGIVLSASSAIIGRVGIDQTTPGTTDSVSVKSQAYSAAVTLTRTADTNAYTANDVIGAATGSTAALTFANMGPNAGRIVITSARFEVDVAAIPSGMTSFRLHLYNATPPSALGDNAPFDLPAGDRASYLGFIDLGSPVDLGSTLYVEFNGINKQIKLAGTSIFAYLVTIGAYTPTSAGVKVITLHSIAP